MIDLNWYLVYAYILGISFGLAVVLTGVVRRLALRWGVLDHPGERKVHAAPMPLMGGVAIYATFFAVIAIHLSLTFLLNQVDYAWFQRDVLGFLGTGNGPLLKLAGLAVGGTIIFVLGVVDDIHSLGPEKKLVVQIVAALVLVGAGMRIHLFIPYPWLSALVTVLWVVMMVNSLNFLDNMDGLCGGVSMIAASALFLVMLLHGHTFICVLLAAFVGATGGFLYHNLNPARIFMGDAGSMFCGYILATTALLGTYYTETTPSRVAVAAPLLALSVPIFDTLSVMVIRWYHGESLMKGDKRHFSHRLVALGMSPRHAVEFIFLVTAITGMGAVLLPQVSLTGTFVILVQAAGTFGLIVLLMNAGNRRRDGMP